MPELDTDNRNDVDLSRKEQDAFDQIRAGWEDEESSKLNPGEQAALDQMERGYSGSHKPLQNDGNLDDLESQASGGWDYSKTSKGKFKFSDVKKLKPVMGILSVLGLAGIAITSFFSPYSFLHNYSANAQIKNDTRAPVIERRIIALLEKKLSGTSNGPCAIKAARCNLGRIPTNMLKTLANSGIVALDGDKAMNIDIADDYPEKKPTAWEVVDDKGTKRTLTNDQFLQEYKNNPSFRSKFKRGYNARVMAWIGNTINKRFYSKRGLSKNGGAATDDLNEKNVHKKLDERLKSTVDDSPSGKKTIFRDRFKNMFNKTAKKLQKAGGDPILTAGTVMCIGMNLPRFAMGAYRAIQVAQLLILVQDFVKSPAGKFKAGEMNDTQLSALGKLFFEVVNGKSASDSAVFQSMIGVNTNKTPVNKFVPGYSLVTNLGLQALNNFATDPAVKDVCNRISSPEAQYIVSGISAAIAVSTAGAGAMLIGAGKAIGKILATVKGFEAMVAVADSFGLTDMVADGALAIATDAVGNYVENVRGEELGDAIGYGLQASFALGGLSVGLAVLTKKQKTKAISLAQEIDNQYREEAIATLSPFDTSSQYTFLGSLVSKFSTSVNISGTFLQSLTSFIGYTLRSPISLLDSKIHAATNTPEQEVEAMWSFDDIYDVDEDVAIGASSYVASGIGGSDENGDFIDMDPEEVFDRAESTGSIDPETGKTLPDGEIESMISDCGDGDLDAVSGCIIRDEELKPESLISDACIEFDDEDNCVLTEDRKFDYDNSGDGSPRTIAAQHLYLTQYAVDGMFTGAELKEEPDSVDDGSGSGVIGVGGGDCPEGTINYGAQDGYSGGVKHPITTCGIPDWPANFDNSQGAKIVEVNSAIAAQTAAMAAELKADAAAKGYSYNASVGFRTYEQQKCIYDYYISGVRGCSMFQTRPPAAGKPGTSNHQMGYSIDIVSSYSQAQKWLTANMSRFGFSRDVYIKTGKDFGHITNKGSTAAGGGPLPV